MNAQIGIDEEGHAYIALSCLTPTDVDMLRHMRSYLPLSFPDGRDSGRAGEIRVTGERLPGSGKGA